MESFSSMPTAADYASSDARTAKDIAEAARDKAQKNEKILDEIHTMALASLIGFYGLDRAEILIREAEEVKRRRNGR